MATTQAPKPPAPENELSADTTALSRPLFGTPPSDPDSRSTIVLRASIAFLTLTLLAVGIFLRGHHAAASSATNTQLPPAPYAASLSFTQLAMSQSTSLSGGTSTFLDGRVRNNGSATLMGITMQVVFRNDLNLSPQVETLPLSLIRTHEPYIDTEPVSAVPLKPGDDREFRLVIETVAGSWNQQMPELTAVHVTQR